MYKKLAISETKKRLLSNFISLSALQIANYILPFITFPYLIRIVGVEKFGLLAFANATIMYFNILTDYGFNLTATKEISIYRNHKNKLIEIFSSVMMIKLILMIISFILLCFLIFCISKFKTNFEVFLLTFGIVIGQVLFPQWFFQGMEKMKYIAFLNILAKSIFTVAIFVFIKNQNDYWKVPLINSFGFISAGLIALWLIKKEFNVKFKIQSLRILKKYFLEGWHIFISRIAVVFYTSSNVFVLGVLTNNTIVGYYSISEKVISAISAFGSIINQVFFPYLSKIWKQNKCLYYKRFFYLFIVVIIIMSILAFLLHTFSSDIVILLSGKYISESIIVLQLLSVTVILFPLGGLFTQSFVTQGRNTLVTKVTFYTTFVNLILVFILVSLYGIYGLVTTIILVQIFQVYINSKYFLLLKKENICVG